MTDARSGAVVREVLLSGTGQVHIDGVAREVLLSGNGKINIDAVVREALVSSTNTAPANRAYVAGLVREVLLPAASPVVRDFTASFEIVLGGTPISRDAGMRIAAAATARRDPALAIEARAHTIIAGDNTGPIEARATVKDPLLSVLLPLESGATAEPPPTPIEWGMAAGGPSRGGPSQLPLEWIGNATLTRDASLPLEVPGYLVTADASLPLAPLGAFGGRFSNGGSAEWLADFSIDRPLPIAAPAFTGASVAKDNTLRLEWHAGVPGAPVRLEFAATQRGDRPVPIAIGHGVALLPNFLLSWSASQQAGKTTGLTAQIWIEYGHSLPGAPVRLEFAATPPGATRNLPLAIAALLRADRLLPAEALSHPPFLFRDVVAPLEWGATPDVPRLQFEWRALLTTDRALPAESTGNAGLRRDTPVRLEFGQNLFVGADALLPLATAALLTTDRAVPLQLLGSSLRVFDQTITIDWLARSLTDRGLILEIARNMNSVLIDRGLPIETTALFSADRVVPIAWLDTAAALRPLPLAMLGDIGRDAVLPAEVTGGAVAVLRIVPIEALHAAAADGVRLGWVRKAARDANMPAEWHSLLTIADAFLPFEILSPFVAAMFRLPLAALVHRLRDMGLPTEAISPAIMARAELPVAIGGNLLVPHPLMAEWLGRRVADRALPAEALRAALRDVRLPSEFGRVALRDDPVAAAMLGSALRRSEIAAETVGASGVALLRHVPIELLRAALRLGEIPAEALHAAMANGALPADFGGDVLHQASSVLPVESSALFGAVVPGPAIAFDALFSARFAELPIAILGTLPPAAIERLTAIGWEALIPPPLVAIDGSKLLASPALVRILEWRRRQ